VVLSAKVPMALNCWVVPMATLGVAGISSMESRAGGVTVKVAAPETPANSAVIAAVPAATAVARPEALMVAIAVFDELQATSAVRSWVALFDSVPVALNCWLVPMAMLGAAGVTAMEVSVAEVSVVEPVTSPKAAVMVVEPAATAVARPEAVMVAAPVFDELQVTNVVRSWVALFDSVPLALNCWLVPMAMLGEAGVTVMDDSAATVRVVELDTPPEVAVMVEEPGAMAVANPAALMVATPVVDELQVTDAVRSRTLPFEKLPMALNCRVVPGAMLALAGDTAMDVRVTGGVSVPPPHPARKTTRRRAVASQAEHGIFMDISLFP